MTRLTTQEIEAIRERAEKATEGPWYYALNINEQTGEPDVLPHVISDTQEVISENMYDENAEFIAHAREDIPKLLAEVERLETAIQDAISIAEMYRENFTLEPWCSLLDAVNGGD